ncbi:MAG: YitT family protein [Clostridia bacterium]|nr:YitT family protein [Clostridia bacterium]
MTSLSAINKKDVIKTVKNTILVVLGTFVLAFGTAMFVIPFELVTGGVSGIGIIINRIFHSAGIFPNLNTEFYASLVNWILFFIGLIFLGKSFAMKTLVSTVVYPIALSLASHLVRDDVLNGFLNLVSYSEYSQIAIVIATVFSGAAIGAGCALTFLGGGSTGGVDIIALVICKYFKRCKSSILIFICDASIIIAGMFVINNLVVSLLGICSAFICAIAIDRMFIGESGAFIAYIVSNKYEEINEAVIRRLNRTTTFINATGGFSGEEKVMLTVTFGRNQYAEFTAIMSQIDKNAFITVHRAHEIGGEGWTKNTTPTRTDDFVIPRYEKDGAKDAADNAECEQPKGENGNPV